MRLKGHEVMRKEIFALSVESSLSQHENQNEIRLSVNQPNIHYCSHPTFYPFLANLQSLNFRSVTVSANISFLITSCPSVSYRAGVHYGQWRDPFTIREYRKV